MTIFEMEQELIALRALLKEATVHGLHDDECQVFSILMERDDNISHEQQIALEDKHCNCWLRYATKVVVEAEVAELRAKMASTQSTTCTCGHSNANHARAGKGLCTSANCACSIFAASTEAQ